MAAERMISKAEEQDLVESTERGEWISVGDIDSRREVWRTAARKPTTGAASESRSPSGISHG